MATNIHLKRKEGESNSSLIYRFTKKVVRSGVLKEVKSRRFHTRTVNRNKRRRSALHREEKRKGVERAKRLGNFKY